MSSGKIIRETIVVDHLFNYFFFLVQWRTMCLRLPKAEMLKDLSPTTRLGKPQDLGEHGATGR